MISKRNLLKSAVAVGIAAGLAVPVAMAQDYPKQPITFVVPYSPGGTVDTLARLLAPKVGDILGQPVVVDNRPGAGASIGAEHVAKSAPDGYTVLLGANSLTIQPSLRTDLPFNVLTDFEPVAEIASGALGLLVNPKEKFNNVADLIKQAKDDPDGLSYGTPGNGTINHLAMELFKLQAGIEIEHIPYQGMGPAIAALLAGEINLAFDSILPSVPHVEAGTLKLIAVSTKDRIARYPDVPPVGDTVPGFDTGWWVGAFVPANTPADAVEKLNSAMMQVLASDELKKRYAELASDFHPNTPAEFKTFINNEAKTWADVVKSSGLKVQ